MLDSSRRKRTIRSFFLPGPAGTLEAMLELPLTSDSPTPEPARAPLAGLVCHPHPLYGGTMYNKVVHHLSLALQARIDGPLLRFNFRGAGRSQGKHDQGSGEADDVAAALDYLAEQLPERGLVLAGFSFGAWVGLRVGCGDPRVKVLVGVGLPAEGSNFDYLADCPKPKLLVQGTEDRFGSRRAVEALAAEAAPPTELVWIQGADHFFTGHLLELRGAVVNHFPVRTGPRDSSG